MEGTEPLTFWGRLEALDQQATLWMNSHFSPAGDAFWAFMSGVQVWIPMYVLIVGLLIWRLGWKRGLVAVACVALCFFFDERINNLIKILTMRVRPCDDAGMLAAGLHALETGGSWSFPSGHANNSFAFALASAMAFEAEILGLGKKDTSASLRKKRIPAGVRRWVALYGIFIVSWATLVAISRVMVGKHFLGDVIVGSVIGILMGLAFGKLCHWILKRVNF